MGQTVRTVEHLLNSPTAHRLTVKTLTVVEHCWPKPVVAGRIFHLKVSVNADGCEPLSLRGYSLSFVSKCERGGREMTARVSLWAGDKPAGPCHGVFSCGGSCSSTHARLQRRSKLTTIRLPPPASPVTSRRASRCRSSSSRVGMKTIARGWDERTVTCVWEAKTAPPQRTVKQNIGIYILDL